MAVRVMVGQVSGAQDCMLVEGLWLNIVLIVMHVVQFRMIDIIIGFFTHTVPCLVVNSVAITSGLVDRVFLAVLVSHLMLDWLLHIV